MKYNAATHEVRKRDLISVKSIDTDHCKGVWEFLKNKDLLVEYLFESGLAGQHYVECKFTDEEISRYKEYEFEYKGKKYVILKRPMDFSNVYEVLDYVHDTELMKWSDNKKYGTKECKFESGLFEFHCICQKDNTVNVDVKYTKCDNKHKNKVTVSTIEIVNADNVKILEAIESWKESFLNEVNSMNV